MQVKGFVVLLSCQILFSLDQMFPRAAVQTSRFPPRLLLCRYRRANTIHPTAYGKSDLEERRDGDMLETVDIEDLPRAQRRFAKQFEKVNEERVKEIFAKNYKNHITLGVLTCLVVGIYYYTIHAVKQETFLEEIDEEMAAERPKTHGHLRTAKK